MSRLSVSDSQSDRTKTIVRKFSECVQKDKDSCAILILWTGRVKVEDSWFQFYGEPCRQIPQINLPVTTMLPMQVEAHARLPIPTEAPAMLAMQVEAHARLPIPTEAPAMLAMQVEAPAMHITAPDLLAASTQQATSAHRSCTIWYDPYYYFM